MACIAGTAFADPVALRPRIEANGASVTLGDVFDGAGEIAGRAIAPAPQPGQVSQLSIEVLAAAASAAGLDWSPPPGVTSVTVIRPGGMRATLAPNTDAPRTLASAAPGVRRGDAVTVSYEGPGVRILLAGARALDDAGIGQSVRVQSSGRVIDAVVTGAGAARAGGP